MLSFSVEHPPGDDPGNLEEHACILCGYRDYRILLSKFDLPISRCKRCGLVSANPRLPRAEIWKRYNFDYFWEEYLPSFGFDQGKWSLDAVDDRYRPQLNLLLRSLGGPSSRLLELGAGAGFFSKAAERAGWSVVSTELSMEAARFARNELDLNVSRMNVESLGFPTEDFDAVVAFELIEHLLDPKVTLQEARRVLRPGGVLLITTPNYRAVSRIALGKTWHVVAPAEHLHYFTEASLRKLLRNVGFSEVAFQHRFEGFGVVGTMNPCATHAPDSLRASLYRAFVRAVGDRVLQYIQRLGRGDTLMAIAR